METLHEKKIIIKSENRDRTKSRGNKRKRGEMERAKEGKAKSKKRRLDHYFSLPMQIRCGGGEGVGIIFG